MDTQPDDDRRDPRDPLIDPKTGHYWAGCQCPSCHVYRMLWRAREHASVTHGPESPPEVVFTERELGRLRALRFQHQRDNLS